MRSFSHTKTFPVVRSTLGMLMRLAGFGVLGLALVAPAVAQSDEFDSYKIRIEGFWAHSSPSGSLQGSADTEYDAAHYNGDSPTKSISTWSGESGTEERTGSEHRNDEATATGNI